MRVRCAILPFTGPAADPGRAAADVEKLWMNRANPVEKRTREKFLPPKSGGSGRASGCGRRLRDPLRLIRDDGHVKSSRFPTSPNTRTAHVSVHVHRFNETICGRAYEIEVLPVKDRWRAQLRRIPGMPTAMMPFYGQTPDEAARQLSQWLSLAHERQAARTAPL
jgi:hypothetical protein